MKNVIFCVANITGFTTEYCKVFPKSNCKSLVYFASIKILHRLVSSPLFKNQFSACSQELELSAQQLLHDNQYTFKT